MSCILIRYTDDENLELIQPLVQEYSTLFFFQDGHKGAIFSDAGTTGEILQKPRAPNMLIAKLPILRQSK
jgi:hypothetical protein